MATVSGGFGASVNGRPWPKAQMQTAGVAHISLGQTAPFCGTQMHDAGGEERRRAKWPWQLDKGEEALYLRRLLSEPPELVSGKAVLHIRGQAILDVEAGNSRGRPPPTVDRTVEVA